MAEIMGRMAEQKQIAVQAAERKLCERLNELAAALTAQADVADASRSSPFLHIDCVDRCPSSSVEFWGCAMRLCNVVNSNPVRSQGAC